MKIDFKSKLVQRLTVVIVAVLIVVSIGACVLFAIDWNYCQHTLEEVEKVDATCMKIGRKTAYKCTKCGKLFSYGYLNGKDGKKGLCEIQAQETSDYADHVINEFYGDLKSTMKNYQANSLEDYSVWSHCAEEGCGLPFEVDTSKLVPFAPADNLSNAKHVVEGEHTDATRFEIKSGFTVGDYLSVTTSDSGMNNATHEIPFTSGVDRYVVLFFHNDGNYDVDINYGIECYGERAGVDVTVPANGYASGAFTINVSRTQDNSWQELYIKSEVKESFNLTVSGYYYHDVKLQNISVKTYPQTEYAIGEKFNDAALKIAATYADGVSLNVHKGDYELSLSNGRSIDEPLTAEDKAVYVTYGKKQIKIDIVVKRFEQKLSLKNAKFADGSTEKTFDRNAAIPTDITANNGKKIAYFIDQYGAKYLVGEGTIPAYDAVLTPVEEGFTLSDNYALGKDVTASTTGHNGSTSSLTDGKNYDNSTEDSRWSSKSNDEAAPNEEDREWVTVDLGESKSIFEIKLYPRIYGSYFPEAYEIYLSEDGENWTKVVTVEKDELAEQGSTKARVHLIDQTSARYVKVVATKMTDDHNSYGYIFQLGELEVYGLISEN